MEGQSISHTNDQVIQNHLWADHLSTIFLTGMDFMMKKMGQMMNGLTSKLTSRQDFTKHGKVGVSYHFPSLTDMDAVLNSTQAEVDVSQLSIIAIPWEQQIDVQLHKPHKGDILLCLIHIVN